MNKIRVLTVILAISLILSLCGCNGQSGDGDEFPSEVIEFVIPYSAGGATDVLNRYVVEMLNKSGISDATFTITNMPGGSTSVGHKYVAETKTGDDYVLLGTASSLVTGALMNSSVPGYDAFTAIAMIGAECGMWCVGGNSTIQTLDDLVTQSKTDQGVTIAISSLGTMDHACILKLADLAGGKFVVVPNNSDSEAMIQAMNGTADVFIGNPRTVKGQLDAGELRAIGITAPERINGFDCPTFTELGYDIASVTPKCIMAPPDISDEAKEYYIGIFKALTESEEWTKYIDSINGSHVYLFGDELFDYLKSRQDEVKPLFEKAGLI